VFGPSGISPILILKHFLRVARHPWIGAKLAKLEVEKRLFRSLLLPSTDGRAGKIRQVSVRITDLCNLRCRTCGQWGERGFLHGGDPKAMKGAELPPSRYRELFVDLAAHGHRPLIYFWGGEPMLYAGLLDLIDATTSLGMPTSIATNGTGVAEAAQALVHAPLFLLQVSIDGHCAQLHNALRPSAGSGDNFSQVQAALSAVAEARQAREARLPLIAALTVVSQGNRRHLMDIYEAFRRRVDLFVFYLAWWIDEEHADAHEGDFSRRFGFAPSLHRGWLGGWRPDDFTELDGQLSALLARSRSRGAPPVTIIPNIRGVDRLRAYYTDHKARFGFQRCVSIYQAVEINSNGDVSPCRDYHDYVVGNVRDRGITELWNAGAYRRFRRSLARDGLMPVCSRCCGLMGY
jgi:radical SAM protein with 4Fe4S-binding SPASM domain